MTDTDRHLSPEDYLRRAQKALADFDLNDGLKVNITSNPEDGGFLEISGSTQDADFSRIFTYRASQADLEAHGDTWFTRRALRSLNDMHQANHLPVLLNGSEAESQTLRPQEEYEL